VRSVAVLARRRAVCRAIGLVLPSCLIRPILDNPADVLTLVGGSSRRVRYFRALGNQFGVLVLNPLTSSIWRNRMYEVGISYMLCAIARRGRRSGGQGVWDAGLPLVLVSLDRVDTARRRDEAVHRGAVISLQAARKIRISNPSVVAVSAAGLLLLRGIPRLRAGTIHLEDGQVFFSRAHYSGFAAILEPYLRYMAVIPRIVAALLDPFPVTAAPVLYPLAALLIHVAMLTPALSARLDWIIPGQMLRAVLFALLCLMPGLWESLDE
jgi:hypothetical protein